MWKFTALLICLSGYCFAGPVGQKQRSAETSVTETEADFNEDPSEMMIMSTLSLPSNATSIRADITDGFSCDNKTYGYYADVDNDCQIFHVCLPVTYADGKENTFRWSFICPEDTIFSQDSFTCMRPDDMTITCEESYQYYELNRNFGMIDSNTDKEISSEVAAAVTVENNENVSEVEYEAEPVQPIKQAQEEQTISQAKPVNVPKPSRRKPSNSYPAQRKPVNSYPLRKIPQTSVQTQASESSTNHISPVTNESMKPVAEEEELKTVVHKFSRRPVTGFMKDKMPESPTTQVSAATNENVHPMEEGEIKPVVHKFSRRPVTVMNNSIKDKIQNGNVMPSRSDLYNQLRKRPSIFNKKPAEAEQAKVEIPQEQQNFSPLAADMSNSNSETHMADAEIEVSESNHVFVKPQAANEISQSAETTNYKSEEPAQVLEAFEEIPAVISEVVEIPNAQEEETHNEQSFTVSNEKSDNVEEPQIIEAVQSAEDSDTMDNVQQVPEKQEDHFTDETETITKMPNTEETHNIEEAQLAGESESAQQEQAVEAAPEIPQSLRNSAEVFQGHDETKTIQEPINNHEAEEAHFAEETQNIEEHQAVAEMQNVEDHQVAQASQNVAEYQTAEEMQNIEDPQVDEEPLTVEGTQNIQELQATEEIQNFENQQASEESETPKETQTIEKLKADEDSQNTGEVPAVEEVLTADEVSAPEEVLAAEQVSANDSAESEEESQALNENAEESQDSEINSNAEQHPAIESHTNDKASTPEQNEAPTHFAENIQAEDFKPNSIQEQTQNADETLAPAEETIVIEESEPIIHQVEESLVPQESEEPKLTAENVESEKVSTSLGSDNVNDPAMISQPGEEGVSLAAAQTIEQMESEKPAEAPESMPATDEMKQPQPIVQQMYEDMNLNKQSLKGLRPVDPIMAQEAEQLIVDFINTLRKNDFTNETPGAQIAHHGDETSAEEEVDSNMAGIQDTEKTESNPESVGETNNFEIAAEQDEISEDINEAQATDTVEEKPEKMQEAQEMVDLKQEVAAENEMVQDDIALKSLENQSIENMDETQPSQESVVGAMNLPQEMYQIPVKVVTYPVEEQSLETEIRSSEIPAKTLESSHENETPAIHMAGNKPLSIDDIVELVKERLDHMPNKEMETPMQLEHVLGEAQEDRINEEHQSSATQEDEQQPNSQSVEETVMPIYRRIAEPIQIDAEEQNEALKPNTAEQSPQQTLDDISEVKEKTNRSYKTKLDSRKRRFLFKADSS